MNTQTTKTALVTGGSSGIGRASALALADAGYDVAICGRRREGLDATVALHEGSAGSILPIVADLSNEEGAVSLFDELKANFSRLDVLFNNAGMSGIGGNFADCTFENWRKVLNINLDGMFLCSNLAFRWMKGQTPQGGRIINNGSISADVPRPGSAPYTASKHGVTGLTRSISLDGRKFNIACGQINIGNAASEMTADFSKGLPQADGSNKPEPTIDVNHVANAIVHMASLPLDANVQFMTIMATAMPYIGRG